MQYYERLRKKNKLFIWKEYTRAKNNTKGGEGVDLHIQPGVEIIFVTDGKIDIHANGMTETASTNEAALIFPFQPHGYTKYEGSEFIRFDLDRSLARDFFKLNDKITGEKVVFKTSPTTEFIVRNNFINKSDASIFTVQSFIYSAIDDFTKQINIVSSKRNDSIITDTIDYIIQNKEQDLKMSTVAKALGYSESHFSYTINKTTGFGFNTLLAMLRIESAKKLLRETEKTILEIVLECGFGSECSFYRQFKEATGVSPLKFRKFSHK